MKNVFITGGAGYVATHTMVELLNGGYNCIAIDNLNNSSKIAIERVEQITGKKIKFYKGDLTDAKIVNEIFSKDKIDSVIHFAALKAVGESVKMPLEYYENNLQATLVLLKAMKEHNVKNLVFSSSATVYGIPANVPISEDFPLSATNPYGATKIFIERILQDLYVSDNTFNVALLRYFNPIGAHESGLIGENPKGLPNNLVPFVSQVAIGKLKSLKIYGNDYDTIDGTGVRDYIHVVDLSLGHVLALKKLESSHIGIEAYNIGTGKGYSVLQVVEAFEKACGKKINYEFTERRKGDIAECYADCTKAEKELG
ncbi:MAG: UDP-glucose 4-epimerase GalE, partial [Firmicutes bacterium]|nr:UDP-glucose 4-epimerase GalE [Bacillota bacterium]